MQPFFNQTDSTTFKRNLSEYYSFRVNNTRKEVSETKVFIKNDKKGIDSIENIRNHGLAMMAVPFILKKVDSLRNELKERFSTLDIHVQAIARSFNDVSFIEAEQLIRKAFVKEKIDFQYEDFNSIRVYLAQKYPALDQLIAIKIDNIYAFYLKILTNYAKDYTLIEQSFGLMGRLNDVKMLGDAHANGQAVSVLTFENGKKLIYKPQETALYQLYDESCTFLNKSGLKHSLRINSTIYRKKYGWFEFIENSPLQEKQDAERYYYRLGVSLCLLYVLNGRDFHFENIIASGEYPMLIDMECLLYNDSNQETDVFDKSVLVTGLLPNKFALKKGEFFEVGGGSYVMGQVTPVQNEVVVLEDLDNIRVEKQNYVVNTDHNVPKFQNEPQLLKEYTNAFTTGFEEAYSIILGNKTAFSSMLRKYLKKNINARILLRPTVAYSQLLNISLDAENLTCPIKREVFFHLLYYKSFQIPHADKYVAAEIQDLIQHTVPLFTTNINTTNLQHHTKEIIGSFFGESSASLLLNKIERLSEEDRDFQKNLINLTVNEDFNIRFSASDNADTMISQIEENIAAHGFWNEGKYQFIDLQSVEDNRFELKPTSSIFYNGSVGLLLFYTYLYKIYQNDAHKLKAYGIYENIKTAFGNWKEDYNLGVYCGAGGFIYALCHFSEVFEDKNALEFANEIVKYSETQTIDQHQLDIFYGTPGYLIALAKLYSQTKDKWLLEKIKLLFGDILSKIDAYKSTFGLSFAHGLSGVLYALFYCFDIVSEDEKVVLGQLFIRFENLLKKKYSTEIQIKESSWCRSEIGIGMMYFKTCHLLERKPEKNILDRFVAIALTQARADNHSLCHGKATILELLFEAQKHDSTTKEAFQAYKKDFISSLKEQGVCCGTSENKHSIGFMCGTSGIAYTLMRCLYDELPSLSILD